MSQGRRRVVIEGVLPQVDGGRFPIKRVTGETVVVEGDIFADGHDLLSCVLLYRTESTSEWSESPMDFVDNDRWRGEFKVDVLGRYAYTIEGWVDHFKTWRTNLVKRIEAGQDIRVDILIGADLIDDAAGRASGPDAAALSGWAADLRGVAGSVDAGALALDLDMAAVVFRYPDRRFSTRYERELWVRVERERARYSAWYEMFPRSCAPEPGRHGTFADCEARLPYVSAMGFDVLYLPPVHPIGHTNRKGRNNAPAAGPNDVGSPWAIGSEAGGHDAIEPKLGTLADFLRLMASARKHGLELAMDLAFQCTPDHPWVRQHPEWFRSRPDGTIQYAENPPKKYQDIYPLDFETAAWEQLWEELRRVVFYWCEQGVRIFRVDNPHTKAFPFWEWLIPEVQARYPETIFLAEAFTRPKVMYRLAKLGFSQSYTYFTWRNTSQELTEYFTELTTTDVHDYMRPNLWPNTPDILPEHLELGGRPASMVRLVLAATLGASYGIYGPAFELVNNVAKTPGSEEYFESEKYEIKTWNLDSEWSLKDLISRVNLIRKENVALHQNRRLVFHEVDNGDLLCYSKTSPDLSNAILIVVNLDFRHTHSGWVNLDLKALGLEESSPFQVHDLLGDGRYLWQGSRNYVELSPQGIPAHIFKIRRRVRSEQDFDYYL